MNTASFPKLPQPAVVFGCACVWVAFIFMPIASFAAGEDNPTGVAGQFNGNVTTGGSYDPYTGNATRSITDLKVAGGIGEYPLAFTRTLNSRYNPTDAMSLEFGRGGNWRHSYQWSIDPVTTSWVTPNVYNLNGRAPNSTYNVDYPDGRRVHFAGVYSTDLGASGPKGIRERIASSADGTLVSLLLPDGGKVQFAVIVANEEQESTGHTATGTSYEIIQWRTTYTFKVTAIIDPYGQTTTIAPGSDSTGTYLQITEPAGRNIKIYYTQVTWNNSPDPLHPTIPNDTVVSMIQGSDGPNGIGRGVTYTYIQKTTGSGAKFTVLDNVVYFGDSANKAIYTYQDSNLSASLPPLVRTCIDPMFDGPMWAIGYVYAPASAGTHGQIQSENYYDRNAQGTLGVAVSTLTIPNPVTATRTETRGDNPTGAGNPSRTFAYNGLTGAGTSGKVSLAYLLASTTDFKGVAASQTYDENGFIDLTIDRNGNRVAFDRNRWVGNVEWASYPFTPEDSYTGQTQRNPTSYGYGGCSGDDDSNNNDSNYPSYLFSIKNSGNLVNKYYRDASKRVITIKYYDSTGATNGHDETFTYDTTTNNFGQKTSHTLRDGGVEQWDYNAAGQLTAYWDAEHPKTGNPTARYSYDTLGNISGVTDGLGAYTGDLDRTTWYAHNKRGQITTITHPDQKTIVYGYSALRNGALVSVTDENAHTTTYVNDNYKRVKTCTSPLRATGDTTPRTTYTYYGPGTDDYSHTDASAVSVTSPGSRTVRTAYDENLRPIYVTKLGDANVPDATVVTAYDSNGNATAVSDPNHNITKYYYDGENRLYAMDDADVTHRNSPYNGANAGHTWNYVFDPGGKKVEEHRVDDKVRYYHYDQRGHVDQMWDFNDDHANSNAGTIYSSDVYGNVLTRRDQNSHTYTYTYDHLNRKRTAMYPPDANAQVRTEKFDYDIANHMYQYTSPGTTGSPAPVQTLHYDRQGRVDQTSWSANGPTTHTGYDFNSRILSVTTDQYTVGGITVPATAINYQDTAVTPAAAYYDGADNNYAEDQSIAGSTVWHVTHNLGADRNHIDLGVSTGGVSRYQLYFDYTSRNELLDIQNSSHAVVFAYDYDYNGNVTSRTGLLLNDKTTMPSYDALNRPKQWLQFGVNGTTPFATDNYEYDIRGNLLDTWRVEDGNRGERFTYTLNDQLSNVVYAATGVSGSSPTNGTPASTTSYALDALNRNGNTSVTKNGTTTSTNFVPNALNQYTSVGGRSVGYDSNFNVSSLDFSGTQRWTYVYDAQNRMVSASTTSGTPSHNAQFVYDGLGRCVRRVIDGTTTLLGYDGWKPIIEGDANGVVTAMNIYGRGQDEILKRITPTTSFYYKSDAMGNVRFVLSNTGALVEKYSYDAFGAVTVMNASGTVLSGGSGIGNRFLFKGREYLVTLGIYDNRKRMYHPGLGVFMQTDPIGFSGDASNLYRFCGHNPMTGSDPMGEFELDGSDWGIDWGDSYTPTYSDAGAYTPEAAQYVPDGNFSSFTVNGTSLGSFYTDTGSAEIPYYSNLGFGLSGVTTNYYAAYEPGLQGAPLGDLILNVGALSLLQAAEGMIGGTAYETITGTGAESSMQGALLRQQLAAEEIAGVRLPQSISGYTAHGFEQAAMRDYVGVSEAAIQDAWESPISIVGQTGRYGGAFQVTGTNAVVIVNAQGRIITTWATNSSGILGAGTP